MPSDLPLLIIGGGPAGLSLGQGLLKHNQQHPNKTVPFRIFERDQAVSFRAQGYRIRISEDGGQALQTLLPEHLWQLFEASCAEVIAGGHAVDARIGTQPDVPTNGQRGPPRLWTKSWNADRAVFRNVLLQGLETHVSFGKRLDRYELCNDGSVLAHFADGSFERGSMIIGADGTRSAVRRQMLPGYTILDTEGRAVFGKTPITDALWQQIPTEIGQGLTLTGNPEDNATSPMKLFSDVMKFQRHGDLTVSLPPDYVYWVLSFQRSRSGMDDTQLSSLSKQQSADLALSLTQAWREDCRNIIASQDIDATSTLAFYTSKHDMEAWQPSAQVTVLGDAAHPMPPVGGVGANSALQDAVALFEVLKKGRWTAEDVGECEEQMRKRVGKSIEQSAMGAGKFFGMKPISELKPVKLWS